MPRKTLIQLRRGTAAQWTAANPPLADGELGLEIDTGRAKAGDGSAVWSSRPYIMGDSDLGSVIATGQTASAGQTSLPLRVGDMALPPTVLPGIPVARRVVLKYVCSAFAAAAVTPASPWTLTLNVRRSGELIFFPLATCHVNTE